VKIGLLGGSFNPAHDGHVHISLQAIRQLGLDEVWWLVSPQNPLKSTKGMASYEQRLASVLQQIEPHNALKICEIEQEYGLHYTAESLALIRQLYPQHQFVWLMGSDNLAQFHRWKNWCNILNLMQICVFDRAPHSHRALRSRMAIRYAAQRITNPKALLSTAAGLPRWIYLFIPRNRQSATAIRNTVGTKGFLR